MPVPPKTGPLQPPGLTESSVAAGEHVCSLAVTDQHQNIQGVIHGSVVIAVLDTAMGHALTGLLGPGEFCSTTQLSVQFLRAARPGDRLEARGKVVRKG